MTYSERRHKKVVITRSRVQTAASMERFTYCGIAQGEGVSKYEMLMADYRIKPMIVLVLPSRARS
jgi:hypothetical protein